MDKRDDRKLTLATLGDLCLDRLVEDPKALGQFMNVAGLDGPGLRAVLGTEHLSLGLVDYFASNEHLMVSLCASQGFAPEDFMRVWHAHNRSE